MIDDPRLDSPPAMGCNQWRSNIASRLPTSTSVGLLSYSVLFAGYCSTSPRLFSFYRLIRHSQRGTRSLFGWWENVLAAERCQQRLPRFALPGTQRSGWGLICTFLDTPQFLVRKWVHMALILRAVTKSESDQKYQNIRKQQKRGGCACLRGDER